jgi:hypothetical protein
MLLTQIAEGWFNKFLKDINLLDESYQQLGKDRIKICLDCPIRTGNTCDREKTHRNVYGAIFHGCGCNIEAKTLCKDCSCPGNFW